MFMGIDFLCLRVSNMHIMYFNKICPLSSYLVSLYVTPLFISFIYFKKNPIESTICTWMKDSLLMHGRLRKLPPPSHSSHHLPIAPQLWMGFHKPLPMLGFLAGLILYRYSCSHRCHEFMCAMTWSCQTNMDSLQMSTTSGSYVLSTLFHDDPWALETGGML